MEDSFALRVQQAQALALENALLACNARTERCGLALSAGEMTGLVAARRVALQDTGRVEPGAGALPRIIDAFCDSPYLTQSTYADTLGVLQDLFYAFKNETEESLTDEELIDAMAAIFNGRAQGSLEYLENLTPGDLWRTVQNPDALRDDLLPESLNNSEEGWPDD